MSLERLRSSEDVEALYQNLKAGAEDAAFEVARIYVEKHGGLYEGAGEFVRDYFKAIKVSPVHEIMDGQSLVEAKEHLRTDPGIVLSNHPFGPTDIPALVQELVATGRKDIKVMVKPELIDRLPSILSPHIVPATRGPKAAGEIKRQILGHINEGGLFVMFPGGGDDGIQKWRRALKAKGMPDDGSLPQIRFKSFVAMLLMEEVRSRRQMSADELEKRKNLMVYSFYTLPEDAAVCVEEVGPRIALTLPSIRRGEISNPYPHEDIPLHIKERYAPMNEWIEALKSSSRAKGGSKDALTRYYLDQFGVAYNDSQPELLM